MTGFKHFRPYVQLHAAPHAGNKVLGPCGVYEVRADKSLVIVEPIVHVKSRKDTKDIDKLPQVFHGDVFFAENLLRYVCNSDGRIVMVKDFMDEEKFLNKMRWWLYKQREEEESD